MKSRVPAAEAASDDGFEKRFANTEAVFVEWKNGFSAGSVNGNSAARSVKPFSIAPESHHARVLEYFRDSGLPTSQRGHVSLNTTIQAEGVNGDPKGRATLVGFTSIVHRVVDGIPIPDSFAWARFNENDAVTDERVWWPELSSKLHDEIALFEKTISGAALSEYQSKLPVGIDAKGGRLVIHHALPMGESWYECVTFDVANESRREVRTFRLDGTEVHLASWTPDSGNLK